MGIKYFSGLEIRTDFFINFISQVSCLSVKQTVSAVHAPLGSTQIFLWTERGRENPATVKDLKKKKKEKEKRNCISHSHANWTDAISDTVTPILMFSFSPPFPSPVLRIL